MKLMPLYFYQDLDRDSTIKFKLFVGTNYDMFNAKFKMYQHYREEKLRGGLWASNENPGFPEHSEKTANRKAAFAPARVSSCI